MERLRNGYNLECGFDAFHYLAMNRMTWSGVDVPSKDKWQKIKQDIGFDSTWDEIISESESRNIINATGNLHKNDLTHGWSLMKPKQEYLMSDKDAVTEQAKRLQGAYAGFQPKPAVELILTVMKPLKEKTFVDQALSNGKGVTWLDHPRIPYQSEDDADKSVAAL